MGNASSGARRQRAAARAVASEAAACDEPAASPDDPEGHVPYYTPDEAKKYERALPQLEGESRYTQSTKWTKGRVLGAGAFGRVYVGMHDETRELIAVKEVNLADADPGGARMLTLREIDLMRGMEHPNIVRFLGTQHSGNWLYIFMEYVAGGSVRSQLDEFGPFDESLCRRCLQQVVQGLTYLHDHHVMHRDLKAANLLADQRGVIKLADFGCAKLANMAQSSKNHSLLGSPYWMAPEVVRQDGHGRKADIWSLGCTALELLTGKPPWYHLDNAIAVLAKIGASDELPLIPDTLSPAARDFVVTCMRRSPADRPHVHTLAEHPFITGRAPTPSVSPSKLLRRLNPFQTRRAGAAQPAPHVGPSAAPARRIPIQRSISHQGAPSPEKPRAARPLGRSVTSTEPDEAGGGGAMHLPGRPAPLLVGDTTRSRSLSVGGPPPPAGASHSPSSAGADGSPTGQLHIRRATPKWAADALADGRVAPSTAAFLGEALPSSGAAGEAPAAAAATGAVTPRGGSNGRGSPQVHERDERSSPREWRGGQTPPNPFRRPSRS